jgi:4a-hydroxytetrahydrobiopterin dehydratase
MIMQKLSDLDIKKRLIRFPEWDYFDNAIHAEFEFENFKDCFSAMSRIAFECEALNHHPNWSNVYNVLTVAISTHSAGGVTDKDFKLAEAIEFSVEPDED